MGLSVLDWYCECCAEQYNPAMEEAGLGDGNAYERDCHKVCKHCAEPTHPFPCQLFLDQNALRFKLLDGKRPTRTGGLAAQRKRMAERYALHVNQSLSGRHAVLRMKTDEATVGGFVSKWFCRDWTPYRPHRNVIKGIKLDQCDGGYLVRVTFTFGGDVFVLRLKTTIHPTQRQPQSLSQTTKIDFDYASTVAERNVDVTVSDVELLPDSRS